MTLEPVFDLLDLMILWNCNLKVTYAWVRLRKMAFILRKCIFDNHQYFLTGFYIQVVVLFVCWATLALVQHKCEFLQTTSMVCFENWIRFHNIFSAKLKFLAKYDWGSLKDKPVSPISSPLNFWDASHYSVLLVEKTYFSNLYV